MSSTTPRTKEALKKALVKAGVPLPSADLKLPDYQRMYKLHIGGDGARPAPSRRVSSLYASKLDELEARALALGSKPVPLSVQASQLQPATQLLHVQQQASKPPLIEESAASHARDSGSGAARRVPTPPTKRRSASPVNDFSDDAHTRPTAPSTPLRSQLAARPGARMRGFCSVELVFTLAAVCAALWWVPTATPAMVSIPSEQHLKAARVLDDGLLTQAPPSGPPPDEPAAAQSTTNPPPPPRRPLAMEPPTGTNAPSDPPVGVGGEHLEKLLSRARTAAHVCMRVTSVLVSLASWLVLGSRVLLALACSCMSHALVAMYMHPSGSRALAVGATVVYAYAKLRARRRARQAERAFVRSMTQRVLAELERYFLRKSQYMMAEVPAKDIRELLTPRKLGCVRNVGTLWDEIEGGVELDKRFARVRRLVRGESVVCWIWRGMDG